MGRHKQYANDAERQAAYRKRLRTESVLVDRSALARLETRLVRLHEAIRHAAHHRDPCARHILHASQETTLEALCDWFEHVQATALDENR